MKNELIKHKNISNESIVEYLIDIIDNEKITSIFDLEALENKIFTINNKTLNYKERIDYVTHYVQSSYYDYDGLDLGEMKYLNNLKKNLEALNNEENKVIVLIKILDFTNKDIMFVKEAYNLIINNKM